MDPNLRRICVDGLVARDLPGYAIGGLSGGESKDEFWKMVDLCTDHLPKNKPRYLMGVGFAVDMVVCTALGVDMFDCVYPTRTARFGVALVRSGTLNLKSSQYQYDFSPIDNDCSCFVCKNYTRSYLHHLIKESTTCGQLLSYHNIAYQMRLMKDIRNTILDGSYPEFVRNFMLQQFPSREYPTWVVDSLNSVGIKLIDKEERLGEE